MSPVLVLVEIVELVISLVLDFAGDLVSTSGALVDLLRVEELMGERTSCRGEAVVPFCI